MNITARLRTPALLGLLALLIANYLYFFPALQGKVLEQDDIMMGWAKGKEIRDYRATHDDEPLWTNAMFSGMPAFQISVLYPANALNYVQMALVYLGGKPSSIYIIFSLMLGMYLLLLSQKVDPWVSAIGALAFGFSAFFIISFGAGHNAKVRAAAYIAPTVMGVLLTLKGKRLIGFALTALFVGLSVNANHFQITYYQALLIGLILLVYLIHALREKEVKGWIASTAVLAFAAVVGIGPNISNLWSTYEYTKETMRGGSSELTQKAESKGGLDFDYAMSWSYGRAETFNLIMPNFTGGGSTQDYSGTSFHEKYFEMIRNSYQQQGLPREQAEQNANRYLGQLFYWGDQTLVNGAYYLGAAVFYLFILGLFLFKGKTRTWVISVVVLGVLMAWGKNFRVLNELLFDYLPIYNKFRVPSMTFVLVFFALPFFGALSLNEILNGQRSREEIKKALLRSFYVTGGLFLFFALLGPAFFSFEGTNDAQIEKSGLDFSLLLDDRKALMRSSAFRSLLYAAAVFGILWFYLKGSLKKGVALMLLGVAVMADLWSFDRQHLGADKFVSQRDYDKNFAKSPADETILQDTDPHYRVFNTTAGLTSDSYTSYYHKSIGGYHGAKLIRYQDLIERQLSQSNQAAFDMLNAKWFIVNQGRGLQAVRNPGACGNAWAVNNIRWVTDADAEMDALSDFNPAETAIVDERFKSLLDGVVAADSSTVVSLNGYDDPKEMVYTANVRGSGKQLIVFSEIYYEGGDEDWKAYVDGEYRPHLRVNYLLRGLPLEPGEHEVKFVFEPRAYYLGERISGIFSIVLILSLVASVYAEQVLRKRKKLAA